jgi:hypothetical protein
MKSLPFFFLLLGFSSAFGQILIGPSRELTNYSFLPSETTAVDLDLDGDLDVITREQYFGWIHWYLNDGSGNFSKGGEWAPPIDMNRDNWNTLGYFDYDGDGYLDILGLLKLENENTQSICLARGLEGATFEKDFTRIFAREYDSTSWNDELEPIDFPLQDFNRDGRKDILFENHIVFLRDYPLVATETNADFSSVYGWNGNIPFVDWNNDGLPDLVNERLGVRLNQGRGRFSEEQIIDLPSLGDGSIDRRDLGPIRRTSGDGPLEFCLSYEMDDVDYVSIITKNSDDSVSISATSKLNDLLPPASIGGWSYGVRGDRVVIVSFDQRQRPEIDAYELIWDGTALTTAPIITKIPSYTFGGQGLISEDLNGDGTLDLIVTTHGPDRVNDGATDEIFWLQDSVGGPYETIRNPITEPSYSQTVIGASDIDDDGMIDLLTYETRRGSQRPGSLALWKNSNEGEAFNKSYLPGKNSVLRLLKTIETDASLAALGGEFASHDWPLGKPGFLVARNIQPESPDGSYQSAISYLLQDQTGQFTAVDQFTFNGNWLGTNFFYQDLNNDGIKDLLYSLNRNQLDAESGGSGIFVQFGDGNSFGPSTLLVNLKHATLAAPPVDFDGDGDLDLQILQITTPLPRVTFEYSWAENESWKFETLNPLDDYNDLIFEPYSEDAVTMLDLDDDGDLDQVFWIPTDRVSGFNRLSWKETKNPDQPVPEEIAYLERPFAESFAFPRWALRDSYLLADLDNDGVKDLVVGSKFFSRLEWFKITKATQPPAYTAWATSKGVTGHSASPLADWDGDSWTNWEEFAFGSDPNQIDPNHPGRPQISVKEAGPTLTFSRRRDAANDGIIYQHFQSTNLRSWASWIPAEAHLAPIDEGYEKVSIPLDRPRGFFRVQPMLPAGDQ